MYNDKNSIGKISFFDPFNGVSSRYMLVICAANCASVFSSTLSKIKYTKSNLDNKGGGKSMLAVTGRLGSYAELIGLAEAKIDVAAFNVVMIPALAMEIVCCSITSCNTDLVASLILSNSSIQHTPPSDNTKAPLSKTNCLVSISLVT